MVMLDTHVTTQDKPSKQNLDSGPSPAGADPYETVVAIVNAARGYIAQSRRALYRGLYEASLALAQPGVVDRLCRERKARGDFRETRLVDLVTEDLSDERRAEYAAAMAWMHIPALSGTGDASDLTEYVIGKRGITEIAKEYRVWATANLPRGSFGHNPSTATKRGAKVAAPKARPQSTKGKPQGYVTADEIAKFSPAAQRQIADQIETKSTKLAVIPASQPDASSLDSADSKFLEMADLLDHADIKLANVPDVITNMEEYLRAHLARDEAFLGTCLIYKRPNEDVRYYPPIKNHKVVRPVIDATKREYEFGDVDGEE